MSSALNLFIGVTSLLKTCIGHKLSVPLDLKTLTLFVFRVNVINRTYAVGTYTILQSELEDVSYSKILCSATLFSLNGSLIKKFPSLIFVSEIYDVRIVHSLPSYTFFTKKKLLKD